MGSRFNKILEFIGLVDDEPEEEMDQGRRPVGAQNYSSQNRRSTSQGPARSSYEDMRSRYSSPRPDYDARTRRSESSQRGYAQDYRTSSRSDYASRSEYGQPRQDYYSQRDYSSRQPAQRDPFEDAFDQDAAQRQQRQARAPQQGARGNVVPMRAPEPSHQTVIYYIRQLEECRDVINDLLDNKTVLLNLEDMDERNMQRCIDTLCGAAFALGATLRKASDRTYLIAPKSVEVASTNDAQSANRY